MSKDKLGDRMKAYEIHNVVSQFPNGKPVVARIDGRSFSKFTRGMMRPYDSRMSECMQNTAKHLAEHTGASLVYTQSDEITCVWLTEGDSQMWFGGKLQKLVSQLAAQATLHFYKEVQTRLPEFIDRDPTFDARVWFVPDKQEAVNSVLWRVQDAIKNSVGMAAHDQFSHNALHKKSERDQREMLLDNNINWNEYPAYFKHGTLVKRSKKMVKFSADEINSLPEKHEARLNPDLEFERSVVEFDLQNFADIDDKLGYIFG